MSRVWKTGDSVVIWHGDRRMPGVVELASANGRSLVLSFEGMLAGFVCMAPVLQREDGSFALLMGAEPIKLTEPTGDGP